MRFTGVHAQFATQVPECVQSRPLAKLVWTMSVIVTVRIVKNASLTSVHAHLYPAVALRNCRSTKLPAYVRQSEPGLLDTSDAADARSRSYRVGCCTAPEQTPHQTHTHDRSFVEQLPNDTR